MKSAFSLLLLIAATATPAFAQDREDLDVRVGLGAQFRPDFPGSRDRQLAPLIDIDIRRGDKPFRIEAPDDTFGLRLVRTGGLTFGPAAAIRPSRTPAKVGAPVERIGTTVEIGGFAEALLSRSFRLRGELLRGVNGHEGWVGQIAADHIWRDGDRYAVTLGPRLLLGDGRFQRAYFGVSTETALATGLTPYRPRGGLNAVAVAGGASVQLGPRWGLFGFARGERLVGDASNSPIVRELGSRNQLSAGIGLSHIFTLRR